MMRGDGIYPLELTKMGEIWLVFQVSLKRDVLRLDHFSKVELAQVPMGRGVVFLVLKSGQFRWCACHAKVVVALEVHRSKDRTSKSLNMSFVKGVVVVEKRWRWCR